MNTAAHVIQKIGGTRRAAALLKVPVSTVHAWKVAGHVPAKRQAEVLHAARQAEIPLEPADFITGPDAAA